MHIEDRKPTPHTEMIKKINVDFDAKHKKI